VNTTIAAESPLAPDLALLMARHTADMNADTPPESVHMMDAGALAQADAQFFVLRVDDVPAAMGAIKRIDAAHAEIKSMHVLAELRGHGYARMMLDHLLAAARTLGFARLSLETGTQDMFEPARALYAKAGFTACPPFEGYSEDPNSFYMTRTFE
jgi:putative acetyltransferase